MLKTSTKTVHAGKTILAAGLLALAVVTSGFASQNTRVRVTLAPSIPSPGMVGQQVMWTATVTGGSGRINYRFATGQAGAALAVNRDFSPVNTLPWSELVEGTYHILVEVRDTNGGVGKAGAVFVFKSRVIGATPVVSSTVHPLVALYSAPSCPTGSTVSVSFWPSGAINDVMSTLAKNCTSVTSSNFYVGGMLANTEYTLQQTVTTGPASIQGPQLTFKTGAVNYSILSLKETVPPTKNTSKNDGILLMSFKALKNAPPLYPPTAIDLKGDILWYYWDPEHPTEPESEYLTRPVQGGTFLMLMWGGPIREVDLVGNIVRETNVLRLAEELKVAKTDAINWLSHEALRLPNGHTVTLGSAERLLTNAQGGTVSNPVDVVGDLVIDLDENFQLAWSWSSFNFLNTARTAPLAELCGQQEGGGGGDTCGTLRLAKTANDWTHCNSLLYDPTDKSLLLSSRDQDYVYKINYNNGAGKGNVIWALGDPTETPAQCPTPGCTAPTFTLSFTGSFYQDTYPWFSHQHDIEFDGTNYELYDNGNTRLSSPSLGLGGLGSGDSRGYVFALDEAAMTIKPLEGYDLGSFSPGFGSAQLLSNGDYTFTNGTINDGLISQVVEVQPAGSPDFRGIWMSRSYRSFRMTDLYTYTQ